MINVKLEDFNDKRLKLLKYASNLLRGKGFVEKDGELKAFSEDIVQNSYLRFHKCNLNAFVTPEHLDNYLISVVYYEFLQTIDLKRRNAQYTFGKTNIDNLSKNEDLKLNVKTDIESFDILNVFRKNLTKDEDIVLNELLKGFSKAETSKNLNIDIWKIKTIVDNIRIKYIKNEESSNN